MSKAEEIKPLTNVDVLASQGLVEIYDAKDGAYRQVTKEEAEKMLESLEKLRSSIGGK